MLDLFVIVVRDKYTSCHTPYCCKFFEQISFDGSRVIDFHNYSLVDVSSATLFRLYEIPSNLSKDLTYTFAPYPFC